MQQLLFGHQKDLIASRFVEWAGQLKMDTKKFDACRTEDMAAKARADEASGKVLAVTGTPTFFIGVFQADGALKVLERFSGAKPIADFEATLDPLIAATSQAPPK